MYAVLFILSISGLHEHGSEEPGKRLEKVVHHTHVFISFYYFILGRPLLSFCLPRSATSLLLQSCWGHYLCTTLVSISIYKIWNSENFNLFWLLPGFEISYFKISLIFLHLLNFRKCQTQIVLTCQIYHTVFWNLYIIVFQITKYWVLKNKIVSYHFEF